MAEVPILRKLTIRNSAANASMRFSNSGSTASGVTSRPVKPGPPVVTTTSIAGDAIHSRTRARMVSTSSGTMLRSATTCPAAFMRSESIAPDLSSAISRVSDTVSTANFSGTNCLLWSRPAILAYQQLLRCHEANPSLELRRGEGIAACDLTRLEAIAEPALALLRRTVGEAVRHHPALCLALQRVVTDRRSGA